MKDNLIYNSFAELAGTFVLVSVILNMTNGVNKDKTFADVAIPIGLGLAAAIFLFGVISDGHFNPVVSLTQFFKDPTSTKFTLTTLAVYILAQAIGGMGALQWFKLVGPVPVA